MDTLLTNGLVLTMDPPATVARQVLVRRGRVQAVGDRLAPTDGARVVDLDGRALLPGFADCHVHLFFTGCRAIDLALDGCRSLDDLLGAVADALPSVPDGGTLRGWNFDDGRFSGRRPTGRDLDRLSATTPIVLSRIGNGAALVNGAARRAMALPSSVSGLEVRGGDPTGWLWGEANHRAMDFVVDSLTDREVFAAATATAHLALTEGVTTVHVVEGSFVGQGRGAGGRPNRWLERLRPVLPELPITVVPLDTQLDGPADIARVAREGGRIAGGDLFLDGVLGAAYVPGMARAALDAPYADGQGGAGHLLLDDEVLRDLMREGVRHGISLSAHAVGERAVAQFLDTWDAVAAGSAVAREMRPRIEHGILPRSSDIRRAAELGVVFSVQPVFEARSGGPTGQYADRLGPERLRRTHPLRALREAGVVLAGGSDSPVNAVAPLLGMRAAVGHWRPEHRLSPVEALEMFTTGAAIAGHEEQRRGAIRAGAAADFAVLDRDPRTPAGLTACRVVETWRAGEVAWSLPGGLGSMP